MYIPTGALISAPVNVSKNTFSTHCRRGETHADKETAPTGVQRYVEGWLAQ